MLDTGSILKKLRSLKSRKVLLQLPEGLKTRALEIATELEESWLEVLISVEPCFGGCDVRDDEARRLGCDAVVHVGHSDYGVKASLPVVYEEYRLEVDPIPFLRKVLRDMKGFRRLGLVTSVQYLGSLARASSFLKENGFKVMLGSPTKATLIAQGAQEGTSTHPGQILGCDYSAAKAVEKAVDCFLFLGTGRFHPLGLSLETEKTVLFLDLESGKLEDLTQERDNLRRVRNAGIAKAASAERFGILVSSKPGQAHPRTAEQARKRLEKLGKKAWLLVADRLTPEKLLGLKVEALVNTACPRIREDARSFRKPIISPEDIRCLEESERA